VKCIFVCELDMAGGSQSYESGDEFYLFRHYPGAGSRAMAWMIAPELAHRASVRWTGRVGSLRLVSDAVHTVSAEGEENGVAHPVLCLIGWHGGHGEERWSAFADLRSALQRAREFPSRLVVGDFNVDMLDEGNWDLSSAPVDFPRSCSEDDILARETLSAIAAQAGLYVHVPGRIADSPGGPWADLAVSAPVTRTPPGGLALQQWASCLDLVMGPAGIGEVVARWQCAPSDHAAVFTQAPAPALRFVRPRVKTTWRPGCQVTVERALGAARLDELPVRDVETALREICSAYADRSSCKQRRKERLPLQVRDLLRRAAAAHDEGERASLRQQSWHLLRVECDRRHACTLTGKLRGGRVVSRSKKMHYICAIRGRDDAEDRSFADVHAVRRSLLDVYSQKWACSSLHRRSVIRDILSAQAGSVPGWSTPELIHAFAQIRKQQRLDASGMCVAMWACLFAVNPQTVIAYFDQLAASDTDALSARIHARAHGKTSCCPRLSDLRIIMPLSAAMQVLDCLFAQRLHRWFSDTGFSAPGFWIGSLAKTQPLDIAMGCSQLVERALDDFSRGAICQVDVKQYFDSLDPILVVQWLRRRPPAEINMATLACLLRWQLYPQIIIDAGICKIEVSGRTCGTLTGSRTAGALGRFPIELSLREVHQQIQSWAYDLGGGLGWSGASHVDNVFFVSHSAGGAIQASEVFAHQLVSQWRLQIKPSSRVCLLVDGSPEIDCLPDLQRRWPLWRFSDCVECLGHWIAGNNSPARDWCHTKQLLWNAVVANFTGTVRRRFSLQAKRSLFERSVLPILRYKCSKWPTTSSFARQLDAFQRKCICYLAGVGREVGEAMDVWQRRRSRAAGVVARSWGLWSDFHVRRAHAWHAHLLRPANHASPASRVLRFHGHSWRRNQRIAVGSRGSDAGRMGTRVVTHVAVRWEDSILNTAGSAAVPPGSQRPGLHSSNVL